MMPIWAVLRASSSCLSSSSIFSSSSLTRERLRHGERLVAGELVLRRQLVDLILVAEPLDQLHQVAGERRLVVARGVPQPLQLAELLRLDDAIEPLAELFEAASPRPPACGTPRGPSCEPCASRTSPRIFRFRSSAASP